MTSDRKLKASREGSKCRIHTFVSNQGLSHARQVRMQLQGEISSGGSRPTPHPPEAYENAYYETCSVIKVSCDLLCSDGYPRDRGYPRDQ